MTKVIIMTDTGPVVGRVQCDRASLSENELEWIGFLREISGGSDPAPVLAAVQQVRLVLKRRQG